MRKHLKYWLETMENIKLLEQLMAENLYMYQRTQDMLYLEYIINNIKEIYRLKQKVIFDINIFEQIKGKELDLSVEKIFKLPLIRNIFKRQKEEYYVVSQKEHIIDCKYTKGGGGGPAVMVIYNKICGYGNI